MQSSVQQNFVQFTKPLEGTVNYMYLDCLGKVTVGIGNLIDSLGAASALPFVHNADNSPASQSEIQAEWNKVKNNTSLAQQGYKAAAPPFTTLHLTDTAITQLVTSQLNANQAVLKQTFTAFESWPADAQLGLLSMAWALGAGFASGWPLFKAACLAQNWSAAAQNCQISTAGNAGVVPRNAADVLLFNNAQAVATQKLECSVLHWPNSVSATPSSGSGSGTGGTSAPSSGSGGDSGTTGATDNNPGSTGGAAGSTGGSDSGTTTTGSSSNTDSQTGDDTTSPAGDSGDSGTTGQDPTAGGADTTSPTTDPGSSSTTDNATGADTASDGAEGANGGPDGGGTAVTADPEAASTSNGSDDQATAEPAGVPG